MARVYISKTRSLFTSQRAAMRYVNGVITELELRAKAITAMGPYTTGRLSASIQKDGPYPVGRNVRGSVGTDLWYAPIVHEGADPHMIFPRGPWKLRFFWRKVGREVSFAYVTHPGYRGKNFLTGPLKDIARRRRLRVHIPGEDI